MNQKKIVVLDGDVGSGDIGLEITKDGEYEIAVRLEKLVAQLVEIGRHDIEEPLKFLKGDKEMVRAMVMPALKSRIMGELQATLDRFLKREQRMVEQMVADISRSAMFEAGEVRREE